MDFKVFAVIYLGVYLVGRVIYKKFIAKKKVEK